MRSPGLILILCAWLASTASCSGTGSFELREFTGETQGTTYSIKLVAAAITKAGETAVRQAIQDRLDSVDKTLSIYRPDSEISRFNQFNEATPFNASADLIQVLLLAREVSVASGGAFDVTVAPLVEAWGFGPAKRPVHPPTDEALAPLRQCVGYQKLEIDPAHSTLRKTQPGITCDLNAIAQGFTVDKLAADLDDRGYSRYMIEVGGEVRTRGLNANGAPWRVGIEKPAESGRALELVIALNDSAISTSGDYREYYEENGVRISHTIDPRTGRPITHNLASVSVIHPQCALADAYATALMVLGPEAGYELANRLNLPALFITRTPSQSFSERATPSFANYATK